MHAVLEADPGHTVLRWMRAVVETSAGLDEAALRDLAAVADRSVVHLALPSCLRIRR